jgi:hypothetical protein
MSIPTMTFENLRDIIASPENVYNIDKGYRGDNQAIKQFTTSASDFFNIINSGGNPFADRTYSNKINEQNEIDKNTPAIYESDEIRRGL